VVCGGNYPGGSDDGFFVGTSDEATCQIGAHDFSVQNGLISQLLGWEGEKKDVQSSEAMFVAPTNKVKHGTNLSPFIHRSLTCGAVFRGALELL
jgi:hypothetical protein